MNTFVNIVYDILYTRQDSVECRIFSLLFSGFQFPQFGQCFMLFISCLLCTFSPLLDNFFIEFVWIFYLQIINLFLLLVCPLFCIPTWGLCLQFAWRCKCKCPRIKFCMHNAYELIHSFLLTLMMTATFATPLSMLYHIPVDTKICISSNIWQDLTVFFYYAVPSCILWLKNYSILNITHQCL